MSDFPELGVFWREEAFPISQTLGIVRGAHWTGLWSARAPCFAGAFAFAFRRTCVCLVAAASAAPHTVLSFPRMSRDPRRWWCVQPCPCCGVGELAREGGVHAASSLTELGPCPPLTSATLYWRKQGGSDAQCCFLAPNTSRITNL